jgi:tetratricopeptide (TPR) repeat protein
MTRVHSRATVAGLVLVVLTLPSGGGREATAQQAQRSATPQAASAKAVQVPPQLQVLIDFLDHDLGESAVAAALLKGYKDGTITIGDAGGAQAVTGVPAVDRWVVTRHLLGSGTTNNTMTIDGVIRSDIPTDPKLLATQPMMENLVGWALTVSHELVHLGQFDPHPTPEFENPAWLRQENYAVAWYNSVKARLGQLLDKPDPTQADVDEAVRLNRLMGAVSSSFTQMVQNDIPQNLARPGYLDPQVWRALNGVRSSDTKVIVAESAKQRAEDQKLFSDARFAAMKSRLSVALSALTAQERRDLLSCVCRCGASIVGAGYHPEPGGDSPSCANLANGPCIGGQNGCYRWKMQTSGPCVAACFAAKKVPFDAKAADTLQSANNLVQSVPGGVTTKTDGSAASQRLIETGVAKYKQQKYSEALSDFSQALGLDPRSAEGYRRRGMAKRELKDYAGAVGDFSKAIELDPQSSEAFAGRGQALERSGDPGGAKSDYTRSLELNPRYENALHYRSLLELRQKDFAAAKADCDRLIALNPDFAPAHTNRGVAQEQTGDLRGALADYERAVALSPSDAFARESAARVRAQLGGRPGNEPASPHGTTSSGTIYSPNSRGDAFEGGIWCNARNGSDWLQRTFDGIYEIREISVGKAGSDVSTKGARIVLKLQRPDGTWVVVDELRETNIGWVELSGGAHGRSIPDYRKALTPPIASRAFRIELSGNGWFNVADVRLSGTLASR